MDPNALAGMIFTVILSLLIGGFILLFPLSRRLGLLLEAKIQERKRIPGASVEELENLRSAIQSLEAEVRLLAERQEFTEQLVARKERQQLGAADPALTAAPR
jgi:hypothetical protein